MTRLEQLRKNAREIIAGEPGQLYVRLEDAEEVLGAAEDELAAVDEDLADARDAQAETGE